MTARIAVVWVAAIVASITALAWAGTAATNAHQRATEARASLVTLQDQVAELTRLRALVPRDRERPAAPEDLPRRVSGVIRGCGLPATAVGSFDAGGSARDGDTLTRRASLVLQQVTLPQVGRFLSEWRRAEPRWAVATIEITPRGEAPAAGGDLPLQAVLTLESAVHAPERVP